MLDTLKRSGAEGIELFAARQHFDYSDRSVVREAADWFRSNPVEPFSMHAPLFADYEMGRAGGPSVNVVHHEKSRRINSMDEIKRALETAEQIPFKYLVLHLGEREDEWSEHALEYSLTALEHLKTYASPLGVQLLVENIPNGVTEPLHLLEILRVGHFSTIGVCLDVGHAHMLGGLPETLGELRQHIRSAHLHDNHGERDEHLWPGDGTVDWDSAYSGLMSAPLAPAGVLEIHYGLESDAEQVMDKARRAFEHFDKEYSTAETES
ncbi:MAG TPA: sugar phosphate isomerase/epimerase family protein [Acidobacteriaceae bacterium]